MKYFISLEFYIQMNSLRHNNLKGRRSRNASHRHIRFRLNQIHQHQNMRIVFFEMRLNCLKFQQMIQL